MLKGEGDNSELEIDAGKSGSINNDGRLPDTDDSTIDTSYRSYCGTVTISFLVYRMQTVKQARSPRHGVRVWDAVGILTTWPHLLGFQVSTVNAA